MAKDSKATKSTKKDVANPQKKGGIAKYFKDLKAELKKVVWPSRKQVVNNTGIVISVMVVLGLFLAGVDAGLGKAVELLLTIGK